MSISLTTASNTSKCFICIGPKFTMTPTSPSVPEFRSWLSLSALSHLLVWDFPEIFDRCLTISAHDVTVKPETNFYSFVAAHGAKRIHLLSNSYRNMFCFIEIPHICNVGSNNVALVPPHGKSLLNSALTRKRQCTCQTSRLFWPLVSLPFRFHRFCEILVHIGW